MDDQLQPTLPVNEPTPPPPTIDPSLQPAPVVESTTPPPSSPTTPSKWYKNVWVSVGIAAVVIAIIGGAALWMSGFFASNTKTPNPTPTPTSTKIPTVTPSTTATPTSSPSASPIIQTKTWTSPDMAMTLKYPTAWTVKTTVEPDENDPHTYEYVLSFSGQEVIKIERRSYAFGSEELIEDGSIPQREIRRITTGQIANAPYYNPKLAQEYWWSVFQANDGDYGVASSVIISIEKGIVDSEYVKDVLKSISGLKSQSYPAERSIAD